VLSVDTCMIKISYKNCRSKIYKSRDMEELALCSRQKANANATRSTSRTADDTTVRLEPSPQKFTKQLLHETGVSNSPAHIPTQLFHRTLQCHPQFRNNSVEEIRCDSTVLTLVL
jgi:hypothetical protein